MMCVHTYIACHTAHMHPPFNPPTKPTRNPQHLERNRKDKDSKFRLILIESRIHRLARYYRTTRKLTPNWKYESSTAASLVA